MKNKILMLATVFMIVLSSSFAQTSDDYVRGLESYRSRDWTSAMFFLRKASVLPNTNGDEVLYMLITSEMYGAQYTQAKADCDVFFEKYPSSRYASYVHYQDGRALHFLKQNENAVLVLSDFCHQNPNHELYAAALYWIAESFYAEYNFDAARGLYERIVTDFPTDAKVSDAHYRIEMIDQRNREEKLLYLLKVTGEETLAAREDYERQIRLYQADDKMGLRKQLIDAQKRVEELESQLEAEKNYSASLKEQALQQEAALKAVAVEPVDVVVPEENGVDENAYIIPNIEDPTPKSSSTAIEKTVKKDPEVEALKKRARQLQFILEETMIGE